MYKPFKEVLKHRKDSIYKWSLRTDSIKLKPQPIIGADTNIFTIGSCFASNLASHMPKLGLKGCTHPGRPFFHPAGILQEFERILENCPKQDQVPPWKTSEGFIHPFKHHLHTKAFSDVGKCLSWGTEIDQQAAKNLLNADVIVITLGLIETWYHEASQCYFKSMPPASVFDELKPQLKRLTVSEIFDNLSKIRLLIKKHLNAEIIISVSPIPLIQTFMPYDVRVANNESKSRIRAAVSEFIEDCPDVHYFPSYEMITGAECKDDYMLKDGRHLHRYALRHILKIFIESFCLPEIPRPELSTRWLSSPLKTAGSPTLIEHFPLPKAEQIINELTHKDKKIYLYGTDDLTQEVLYNTSLFDIESFSGLVTTDKNLNNAFGLAVYNLDDLPIEEYCLIIPHWEAIAELSLPNCCEAIVIVDQVMEKEL
jgi:hypothetical protein